MLIAATAWWSIEIIVDVCSPPCSCFRSRRVFESGYPRRPPVRSLLQSMFNTLLHRLNAESLGSMLHRFTLRTYGNRIQRILSSIEKRIQGERNLGAVLQALDSAKGELYD